MRQIASMPERASRPNNPIGRWGYPTLIVVAVLLVYANTFSVPFVFDDLAAITQNETIRRLSTSLSPPSDLSVTGRPLVNFSFALNYAVSGVAPWSYHVLNLAIHALATLALFGIVWRTLSLPPLSNRVRDAAAPLAFFIALLWAIHPLQTAAVTYVMQRTESLMALGYLTTLYAFIRQTECDKSADPRFAWSRGFWGGFSVLACLLGMACKEVMVSAPLVVLLYDRTFVAGSFRAAWTRRRLFYVALAGTWLLLIYLILGTEGRGESAGFGRMSWIDYALTQFFAIAHYLRLALWPHPLVFDYGTEVISSVRPVLFPAAVVITLLVATVIALRRRPAIAFAGMFFFAVLAPSSSVIPVVTQTVAEHRMYLPLAAVIGVAVVTLYTRLGRWSLGAFAAAALALGAVTFARNSDYRSERSIWSDTVAKRPSARAHYNLGVILFVERDLPGAISQLTAAVSLQPDHVDALTKLGLALLETQSPASALPRFEAAVALAPGNSEAQDGLARTLVNLGRLDEALPYFERNARDNPSSPATHLNFGSTLLAMGRAKEALAEFETARQLSPNSPAVYFSLGNAFVQLRQFAAAVARFEEAVRLAPNDPAIRYNLGNALAQLGRYDEALLQFEQAVHLDPKDVAAQNNLSRLREYLRK